MKHVDYCVEQNISIRDAMRQLDKTGKRILFVTHGETLLGALTDGDIRRFLLAGGKMDDAAIQAANQALKTASNREDALRMLSKYKLSAIPIVHDGGQVTGIVFLDDQNTVEYPELHIPVVIMAGGKGTRLDPYTRVLPKPLIPVGELPIIEHIMSQFQKFSCDHFHIIVNYKKQLIKAYFNESEQKYSTVWYDEEQPLGTGGGLYLLKNKLQETFFLTNCDVLLQSNYHDMLQFHRKHGNAITMVCAYKNITIPYGVIEMGLNGSIETIKEKPEFSFLTNTGMYIVEPEVLEDIEDNVPIGFPDIINLQRGKGRRVAVYPVSEHEWLDMGQMTELENMRKRIEGNG